MFLGRLSVIALVVSIKALASPTIYINEAWEGFSSPDILGSGFTHNLHHLPLEGATYWEGPKNWSSDYWASKNGGINYRWNARHKNGFNLKLLSLKDLRRWSVKDLQRLSPSEKYDILLGRYDYPLVKEVASKVSPEAQDWEGICHGWVVATVHHDEPKPKIFINSDGITIPFGSADIKALLSYYYAMDQGPAQNMGFRCNLGTWTGGEKECDQDLNAGAFHIIIANKLALQNEGVILDIDRFKEVWNQPIVGYRSKMKGPYRATRNAARTAVAEYRVSTQLFYIVETEPTWNTVHGTDSQAMEMQELVYRIEVNSRNEIVGGTWESKERPDFIWSKPKAQKFSGYFSQLSLLLNDTSALPGRERRSYEEDYRKPREQDRRSAGRQIYYLWNPYTGRWELNEGYN